MLGLTWEAGAGVKLYFNQYFSLRFDLRDFLLPQEVLGRGRITNNVTVLGGSAYGFPASARAAALAVLARGSCCPADDAAMCGADADEPGKSQQGRGGAGGAEDQDACIDENVKADLFAKRQMRGTRERLFQQTNRHELMLQGGYYVSDLFDGTYVFGGAYAYHMTEDLAIEAAGSYTRISSSGGPELERIFQVLGKSSRARADLQRRSDLGAGARQAAHRRIDRPLRSLSGAGGGMIDSALSRIWPATVASGSSSFSVTRCTASTCATTSTANRCCPRWCWSTT